MATLVSFVLALFSARSEAPLPAARVLAYYVEALAEVRRPAAVSFEYSVEQLGPHTMEQAHRVYRSGLAERDETLVIDGYHLKAPGVRILENRLNRYEIAEVAPRPQKYVFRFEGVASESGGYAYVFAVAPQTVGAYGVSEVEIDARTFLPRRLYFRIAGAGARGSGQLAYASVEGHWVIVAATVSAHLANGAPAHERIRWSNYRFPVSLPASTFELPRAVSRATRSVGA